MARNAWPTVFSGDSWSAAQQNTYGRDNDAAYWVFEQAEDLAVAAGSDTLKRLAKGADNTALNVVSGALAYRTLAQMVAAAPTAITLPMCYVGRTGAKSVNNATYSDAGIQTTYWNTNGFIVANDEIEIPTGMAGKYYITAYAEWETNGNGVREMLLDSAKIDSRPGLTGVSTVPNGWTISSKGDGTKIKMRVWQNSGNYLMLNQARMLIVRIGDL